MEQQQRKKSLTSDSFDQVNKKRTRASLEQLAVLEESFAQNCSPNSKMRETLSEKLAMNERSIQIWFQNRRAKVKLVQKRAQLAINGGTADGSSGLSMQNYQQAFAAASNPTSAAFPTSFSPAFPSLSPQQRSNSIDFSAFSDSSSIYRRGSSNNMLNVALPLQKPANTIQNGSLLLSCDTLSVGTWRRVALSNDDLLCTVVLSESLVRWQIIEASSRFKLEFSVNSIASITLDSGDSGQGRLTVDLMRPPQGRLTVDLMRPPQFFMEVQSGASVADPRSLTPEWTQCRDFTEGHQASSILQHVLTGPLAYLQSELLVLIGSDAYFLHICHLNSHLSRSFQQQSNILMTKRASMSFEGSLSLQRRGSCPPSVMFDQNPSFMLRRGSLLDQHGISPLLDSAIIDSPLGSPMSSPRGVANLSLEISPPSSSLMFSSSLNESFTGMAMLDDFDIDGLSNGRMSGAESIICSAPENLSYTLNPPTAALSVNGNEPSMQYSDFLFDIAQFLDSNEVFVA